MTRPTSRNGGATMTTRHLVIGLALLLTPAAARADDAADQAVKTIEALGGKLTRDEKVPDKPGVAVNLHDSKVTDDDLKDLAGLKQLRALDLSENNITDAGLKHLAALPQLQTLNLRWTYVTDAGMKELAKLKGLRSLDLA